MEPPSKPAEGQVQSAPVEADPTFRHAAEEVRAHLAHLRGGGLFLSPVDGRLLLEWFEAGVPVSTILFHLEEMHTDRRARRVKSPLKLATIKRRIAKSLAQPTPPPPTCGGLAPLATHLMTSGNRHERDAGLAIAALPPSLDTEALRCAALSICRSALEAAWESADKHALRSEAALQLDAVKNTLSEQRFEAIVEEAARDLLRRNHPHLSATAIWDTLG